MKTTKEILMVCIFGLLLVLSCGRKTIGNPDVSTVETKKEVNSTVGYSFPEDWLGEWSGPLNIYNHQGLTQTIDMGLEISASDSTENYNWTIIYGSDSTAQRREYELVAIDTSLGHYMIDEKNGIFLDLYHIHDEAISVFDVMGNSLLISYKRGDDKMIFTVEVFPSKEVRISGDTIINEQEIPEVKSFKLTSKQTAVLQKKCLVE